METKKNQSLIALRKTHLIRKPKIHVPKKKKSIFLKKTSKKGNKIKPIKFNILIFIYWLKRELLLLTHKWGGAERVTERTGKNCKIKFDSFLLKGICSLSHDITLRIRG